MRPQMYPGVLRLSLSGRRRRGRKLGPATEVRIEILLARGSLAEARLELPADASGHEGAYWKRPTPATTNCVAHAKVQPVPQQLGCIGLGVCPAVTLGLGGVEVVQVGFLWGFDGHTLVIYASIPYFRVTNRGDRHWFGPPEHRDFEHHLDTVKFGALLLGEAEMPEAAY